MRKQRTPGWLHALGDAGGKYQLTHMGKYQAKQFAAEFLGQQLHELSTEPPTPQVVFTDPQVASVGLTEDTATDAGYDVVTGEVDFAGVWEPVYYATMLLAKARLWLIKPPVVCWVPP